MYTMRQARDALGVDQKTLVDWLKRAGMYDDLARDDLDRRTRLVSDQQLQSLATAHRRIVRSGRHQQPVLPSVDGKSPVRRSAPSESALNASQRHTGKMGQNTPLPDGWLALSTWCKNHGINQRSVNRAIDEGRLVAPHHGEWRNGQYTILTAFDLVQHGEASRQAAILWPARFKPCEACASLVQHLG
jgi:hypothetical protein